jgi:hypothetical protein
MEGGHGRTPRDHRGVWDPQAVKNLIFTDVEGALTYGPFMSRRTA